MLTHCSPERGVVSMKWFGCCGWQSSVFLYCHTSPPSLEAVQLWLEGAIDIKIDTENLKLMMLHNIQKINLTTSPQEVTETVMIEEHICESRTLTLLPETFWCKKGFTKTKKVKFTHHRISRMFLSSWSLGTSSATGMGWITSMILQQRGRN